MLNDNLKKIINELYSIPNAPFCINQKANFVKKQLTDASIEYFENQYYITTKVGNGSGRKIIFLSHLDHPGFVFKNSKYGTAFGSLYLDKLKEYKPISVFDTTGKYLGDVSIKKVYGRDESKIEVESTFHIPINSQGSWNVGEIEFTNDKIYGRSHDNDIATSILLNNLRNIESNFEIYFVFTKNEEVLQQSAYAFGLQNTLNISANDILINLESMKVYSTSDEAKYSKLNNHDGVVLNISETSCIYGSSFLQRNIAESLVNNISTRLKINLQRGMAGGSSDARVISSLKLTPNIITLNIPNAYKHNVNNGEIVREEVLINDVIQLDSIIKEIIKSDENMMIENMLDISLECKRKYTNFNNEISNAYISINNRLHIANTDIMRRGYFYPTNLIEKLSDFTYKSISYITHIKNILKPVKISKE